MRALPLALVTAAALPACLLQEESPPDDLPPVVTSGTYHHYVQSTWNLPETGAEARLWGFDFDEDGRIDNQAGAVIAALGSVGLDVRVASETALAQGQLVILHSLRADALVDDGSVSWRVLAGAPTATPPRWDGTDVFRVSGEDGSFVGPIIDGMARMGWGTVNVPLPFFPDQSTIVLPLSNARIDALVQGDACEGTIGGVMLAADRERTLELFARQAIVHIERNPTHELARVAYDVFDTNNDGVITVAEMADSEIADVLFAPDIDTDGDGDDDGLSFGFRFTSDRTQFTAPGEV